MEELVMYGELKKCIGDAYYYGGCSTKYKKKCERWWWWKERLLELWAPSFSGVAAVVGTYEHETI